MSLLVSHVLAGLLLAAGPVADKEKPESPGEALGCDDGLLGLLGESVELHVFRVSRLRRVKPAGRVDR